MSDRIVHSPVPRAAILGAAAPIGLALALTAVSRLTVGDDLASPPVRLAPAW